MYHFRQVAKILRNTTFIKLNFESRTRLLPTVEGINRTRIKFYTSAAYDETDKIVQQVCGDDEESQKKLRILMLEVEVAHQDGRYIPDNIDASQWKNLLQLETRNQRNSYLRHLFKIEKSKENEKKRKEAKRIKYEESKLRPPDEDKEFPDDLLYGIQHQSLFLRIHDQSINRFDNYRALQAMRYGLPIVVDCSYEDYMVKREIENAAKQMTFVYGDNRIHIDPFNIHLCNVNMNGPFMRTLKKSIPCIDEPWFPINIHEKSYLDVFDQNKLVYLTPHCKEELTKFNPDDVYIVGCMVDKINNEPLSLAKAKRDNIRMAKLPLDRYIEWAPGAKKNLNINHMIPILLDLKLTGDWELALRHIPRRKLMETKIMAMQKMLQNRAIQQDAMKQFESVRKHKKQNKRFNVRTLYDDDNI